MIKVAVVGLGRMGKQIVEVINDRNREERKFEVVCGVDPVVRDGFDFPVLDSPEKIPEGTDVIVEFSTPEGAVQSVRRAVKIGSAIVSGTTGLDKEQEEEFRKASEKIPVFRSANMSRGIAVLLAILPKIAKMLPDFDVEIVEIHHGGKKDAPSGTALRLAEALGRDGRFVFGREGKVGPRSSDELGIFAVRGGDVVGDHIVFFLGKGERIEIVHRASSRRTFAEGAVKAIEFVWEMKRKGKTGFWNSLFG